MALHDVDRNGPDRGNPSPNTHDTSFVSGAPIVNQPRQSHGTNSVNYTTDATSVAAGPSILAGNLRLVKTGTIEVVGDGIHNTTTTSVAHNLGYRPFCTWSMNNISVGGTGLSNVDLIAPFSPQFGIGASSLTLNKAIYVAVDDSRVYVTLFTPAFDGDFFVTYYLYEQRTQ